LKPPHVKNEESFVAPLLLLGPSGNRCYARIAAPVIPISASAVLTGAILHVGRRGNRQSLRVIAAGVNWPPRDVVAVEKKKHKGAEKE